MGKQHKSMKRRRFQKPDTINIILGSITFCLLLTWGGLHWKTSNEKGIVIHAAGSEQSGQTAQLEDGQQATSSPGVNAEDGGTKTPGGEQTAEPTVGQETPESPADGQSEGQGEISGSDQAAKPNPGATDVPNKPVDKNPSDKGPGRTDNPNLSKPKPPSVKPTVPPGVTPTDPPVIAPTEPPVNQTVKYKQEIIKVQVMCTQDMNDILIEADSAIQDVDIFDPIAFQKFNEQLLNKMATAESKCDNMFKVVIQNAEKDSVSPNVLEEWKQTFYELKEELLAEYEANLQKLMGG